MIGLDGVYRAVIDGDSWQACYDPDLGWIVSGPRWAKEVACKTVEDAEQEIIRQAEERRADLERSRGEEYQAWCMGWERV